MWAVAGVLLGLVVLASLVGLHSGPHAHAVAVVAGVASAVWLVVMVASGRSEPLLWLLLGLDLVVSAGVGVMAWSGLVGQGSIAHRVSGIHRVGSLEGAEGVAVSDLTPHGIVRVRGEQWSVTSMNGSVPAGTPVQVLRAEGVRLEVWGESPDGVFSDWVPGIGRAVGKESHR
jgi:membrane-bound ClpP family serine protease